MSRQEIEEYAASLMEKNGMLQAKNDQLENQMNWLMEQVRLHRQARFGASSEKDMLTEEEQLSLFFNEAESTQAQELPEPELSDVKKRRKKAGSKGESIKNLPVKQVEYTLTAEEQDCPACGEKLHVMKKEVRNEIIVVPAQFTVKRHVRYVYACRNCDKHGTEGTILRAEAPSGLFANSLASPSLVAHILAQKYVYAMPLYRQEQQYARLGMTLSRQTMSNWVVNAAEQYLSQIYDRMKVHLMKESLIHADETELEVLKEPGREATSKSYMWLYRSGARAIPCILYEYTPGRSGDYPKEFLKQFSGYLQTDGYAGYHKVTDDVQREAGTVIGVGCFAHARRKYTDAKKAAGTSPAPNITRGIAFCDALFAVEKECKGYEAEKRKEYRINKAEPTLSAYFEWVKTTAPNALPKSKLSDALTYSENQKEQLCRYLEDGRLELSNNIAERSIKPFVIGRKNWLFSNTPKGAQASAVVYSVAETAKENGLEPFAYFCHVLTELSQKKQCDTAFLDTLLPWSDAIPDHCRMKQEKDKKE